MALCLRNRPSFDAQEVCVANFFITAVVSSGATPTRLLEYAALHPKIRGGFVHDSSTSLLSPSKHQPRHNGNSNQDKPAAG